VEALSIAACGENEEGEITDENPCNNISKEIINRIIAIQKKIIPVQVGTGIF
jgi:hypothetical protein